MREIIGKCQACHKDVFCENGFFEGEQLDGKLYCVICAEKALEGYTSEKNE
ncbi:hypothetical protein [Oceanobacillus halotolerans]|uniref:hypothetical protein n=1 Tax=Oceanobacillus halotolerans TaxID=2663380 RepID=UPI0013DB79A2|nr:hypothetical protein [Oceanobacillus halotolerans]